MKEKFLFEGRPKTPNIRDQFEAWGPAHATACALGKVMSPNGWTLIRLPIVAATIYANHQYGPEVAAAMYAGNCGLDYVDGWVARAIKKVTKKGEKGDPFADKGVNDSTYIDIMTECDNPVFLARAATTIGVDIALQRGRGPLLKQIVSFFQKEPEDLNYKGSPQIGAHWWGKGKTMAQGTILTSMLYNANDPILATICGIGSFAAAAAGWKGGQVRKEMIIPPNLKDLPRIPLNGNTEVLFSPESFREELISSIKNAKERIYIAALYITPDEAGKEIIDALVEAKKCNPDLDIKVLVDFHRNQRGRIGAPKDNPTGIDLFRAANESLPEGSSIDFLGVPVADKETKGVFHTKGIVVDTTLLYSGASINNTYLHRDNSYRLDRYWVFHEETALAESFAEYLKEISEHEAIRRLDQGCIEKSPELKKAIKNLRKKLKDFKGMKVNADIPEDASQAIMLAGVEKGNIVSETIANMIHAAEENVTLYTPYFNISRTVRKSIEAALANGVQVDLIVGDKKANDFYRDPASIKDTNLPLKERGKLALADTLPYIYEQNLRAFVSKFHTAITQGLLNIYVWEDGQNTFHVKGVDIDNGEAILETGHNINGRSDHKDVENGVLLLHPDQNTKDQLKAEKEQILQHARRIQSVRDLAQTSEYPANLKPAFHLMRTAKRVI